MMTTTLLRVKTGAMLINVLIHPIAKIKSEFIEDFLVAEYGVFSTAELIASIRCLSCGMMSRVNLFGSGGGEQ